ncbi:MAG: cation transporting ATPase C-terminal domain-containing protein, partial [Promethearchaeota archaeon]
FILLFIFGILMAISMVIVYYITYSGIYEVVNANIDFGPFNEAYLYGGSDLVTDLPILREAKTLTMLMLTLFFCESFLVLQIRRPNKSLIKSLIEDRNKFMFILIGFLFFVFIALIYIPGVQVFLADSGINFMFMYLTGLDWLVSFLISLICIVSFEIVKFVARRKNITF